MTRVRRCPICKAEFRPAQDLHFGPFCSQRCKAADLGNWLDSRYVIDAGPAPSGGALTNGDDDEFARLLNLGSAGHE